MVEVEFARLIEKRLDSWLTELVPLAQTPGRLYAKAVGLIDEALAEAEESVRNRKAGVRVLLGDVEDRLAALESRSEGQQVGCPEAPQPAVVVPTEVWVEARRKAAFVSDVLRALEGLKPDGNGLERSPDGGGAGADGVPPEDGLPSDFVDWLRRVRPFTWPLLVRDRMRIAALWAEWQASQSALVTTNGP